MKKAFTLIELLIVVAIIAILAAIAVPNFLEAQTRSKVSRAKADIRSLVTATESYFVDHNGYMEQAIPGVTSYTSGQGLTNLEDSHYLWSNSEPPNPNPEVAPLLQILTTPIAYLTSLPPEAPFAGFKFHLRMDFRGYYYNGGKYFLAYNQQTYPNHPHEGVRARAKARYRWMCIGPVKKSSNYAAGTSYIIPYDPTNGTVSIGDIVYLSPGGGVVGTWYAFD